MRQIAVRFHRWLLPLLLGGLLAACGGLRLVADYDAEAAKGITDTSGLVFAHYDKLIEARAAGPVPYAGSAESWGRIETALRVIVVREQARPLNEDSEAIAQAILGFWQKYRTAHQSANDYAPALLRLHRDRFQRLFAAALRAEKAKQLALPDKDPAKEGDS